MFYLKNLFFIIIFLFICSCGKNKDKPLNQDNHENFHNLEGAGHVSSEPLHNKWTGKYEFSESTEGITKDVSQSWEWIVTVDSSLKAKLEIDGFQTMIRIKADVMATERTAEFIFLEYMPENRFTGEFKKGDRLFSFEINPKGEMVTNWDKMQPNIVKNRVNGKMMFKKIAV